MVVVDGGVHHETARLGRKVVEVLVVLVSVQLAFFALLVAAQAVPDGPIVTHLQEAVEEGTYGPTGCPDNMATSRPASTRASPWGQGWVVQT